jgi:hypothetical protein
MQIIEKEQDQIENQVSQLIVDSALEVHRALG